METMAVSITKGVMGPLLAKLTKLMGDEYKMLKGVRKQVSFLKDELSTINTFLEKMELMDELDPLDKNWRSHAREMAYDIEDCIDDFMLHLGGADAKKSFIKKTTHRLKTLRDRHRIANQIEQLKTRALEVSERYTRYKLEGCVHNSSSVSIDPRVKALYTETAKLVGIEKPREELVKKLTDAQQQLKVVSIVGFGGLGKTTLAKEVHHSIGEHFDCKAFVAVSQRADIIRFFNGIQSKLGIVWSSSACEVQEIIDNIRGYLKHKRTQVLRTWKKDKATSDGRNNCGEHVQGGDIDSVLAKLNNLIADKCASLTGVSRDIVFLRDELPAMTALLENLENTDELDPHASEELEEPGPMLRLPGKSRSSRLLWRR